MDRKKDKDSRHKLPPFVDGPYPVTKVDTKAKTFITKRLDPALKSGSHNCIVLAPEIKTKYNLMAEAQPMKITKIVSNYPVKGTGNLRHIDKRLSTPEVTTNKTSK